VILRKTSGTLIESRLQRVGKKANLRSSRLICVAINLQLNLLHLGTGISQRHRTDVTALLNRGWFVLPTGNRPNNQKRFLA
jgi:hypothetical protein